MKGIDISKWQGDIDWKKVFADGIQFAFIKASQGGSVSTVKISPFTDAMFVKNINNAFEAGIYCGVYHYLTGTTEKDVEAEAEYLIKLLLPLKEKIVFPVALDFEDIRYTEFSKSFNTNLINIFCKVVAGYGFIPILYANRSFLRNLIDTKGLEKIDIWYARYNTPRSCEKKPEEFANITVWQWTSSGKVKGISGKTDLNIAYFDYAATGPKDECFSVGDIVSIKDSALTYYEGAAVIPRWVKDDFLHIITKDTFYKKPVYKGNSKCVLLGKKINRKTGKTVVGINSWISVDNLSHGKDV